MVKSGKESVLSADALKIAGTDRQKTGRTFCLLSHTKTRRVIDTHFLTKQNNHVYGHFLLWIFQQIFSQKHQVL